MKQTGIFYEIGAAGQQLSYLLEPDWKELTAQRIDEGKPVFAPADLCEQWIGYFVEPLGRAMADMLKWNKWENAHYIQCAIAGKSELRRASIVEFIGDNPWDMTTLASVDFYETWAKEINSYFVPTLTLDELFASLNAYPDLLRLDIEGAEIETLLSYSFNPKPRIIQIDHHSVNKFACCEILRKDDYTIVDSDWNSDLNYDDSNDLYAEYEG